MWSTYTKNIWKRAHILTARCVQDINCSILHFTRMNLVKVDRLSHDELNFLTSSPIKADAPYGGGGGGGGGGGAPPLSLKNEAPHRRVTPHPTPLPLPPPPPKKESFQEIISRKKINYRKLLLISVFHF